VVNQNLVFQNKFCGKSPAIRVSAERCRAFYYDPKNQTINSNNLSKTMTNNNLDIKLRPTEIADLDTLFQFQLDKEGGYLAAFMPKDPTDKSAYLQKYTKLLSDPTVNNQTITIDKTIVGSIAKFVMEGNAEITYWIDRKFWGQGIATKGLSEFLGIETTRPIFGRVAFDNFGSQKVLEKCGFIKIGSDKGFANARQAEIEEFIYKLNN
jgi:RimJ/RimL family protein N-acetyltransferase